MVNLENKVAPQTTARITLALNGDPRRVSESEITSVGGQAIQVPVQTLVNVRAGMHTVGLAVSAQ